MGTFKRSEGGDGWLHPMGLFPVQLVDHLTKDTEFGTRIGWVWESNVERDDGKPPRIYHWTSDKLHEKSNAGQILTTCGVKLPETDAEFEAFDLTDHMGLTCQVLVVHEPDKKTGEPRANIGNFLPADAVTNVAPSAPSANGAGTNGKGKAGATVPAEKPKEAVAAGATKDPFEDE